MIERLTQKKRDVTKPKPVFIDPRSDFGFKKIFGQEDGKVDLIRMSNAFIDGRMPAIENIVLLNKEKLGAGRDHRNAIYDVYFQDQNNWTYDVEMQNYPIPNAIIRENAYLSMEIIAALQKGVAEKYCPIPITGIFIANFNLDDVNPEVISLMEYTWEDAGKQTPPTRILAVELLKFTKKINELESEKDVYLFLLNYLATLQSIPALLDTEKYRPLFERAKIANLNKYEMKNYLKHQKQKETKLLELQYAREQGEIQGEVQGKIQGEIQGEIKNARRTATILLETTDFDIARIAEITALPAEEIEHIRQDLQQNSCKEFAAV